MIRCLEKLVWRLSILLRSSHRTPFFGCRRRGIISRGKTSAFERTDVVLKER